MKFFLCDHCKEGDASQSLVLKRSSPPPLSNVHSVEMFYM